MRSHLASTLLRCMSLHTQSSYLHETRGHLHDFFRKLGAHVHAKMCKTAAASYDSCMLSIDCEWHGKLGVPQVFLHREWHKRTTMPTRPVTGAPPRVLIHYQSES